MSNLGVTTKIIQQLSNNSGSVVPIAAKDTLSNCAITYIYDKKGSKKDGKEKAIEEFGTEVLWIGGIPLLKKLFDKTVYKIAGNADPGFDVRKFKDGAADSIENTVKNLKKSIKDLDKINDKDKIALVKTQIGKLKEIAAQQGKYKGLHIAKFVTSTAATLLGLGGLIVYKQKTTQKEIENEYKKKMALHSSVKKELNDNQTFSAFSKDKKNVNFKGIGSALSGFMYNPVMNMSILDAGITGLRLHYGREGEKFEIGFKEAFQIAFIYGLARPIEKGLEFLSSKVLKKPIETEYQLLSNDNLSKLIKDKSLNNSIDEFLKKDPKQMIGYIYDNTNKNNPLVEMLKISGEVPTLKKTNTIDPYAFMDSKKLKEGAKNIQKLYKGFNPAKKMDLDKYLKSIKRTKGAAVIANILIGAAAIGILQPTLNILMRKKKNGGSENPAFKNIEAQMEQKFA